jgi:hypothetical protein
MTAQEDSIRVLIGGSAGADLSLSLLLCQQEIPSTPVERRSDISRVPCARNLNFRTLEVFRGPGLEREVRGAGTHGSRIVRKTSLRSVQEEEISDPSQLEPPTLKVIARGRQGGS